MGKKYWIFFSLMVGSVFFVEYDLSRRLHVVREVKNPKSIVEKKIEMKAEPSAEQLLAKKRQVEVDFANRFKTEALEISKAQLASDEVQARLKKLSAELTPENAQGLYEVISNESNDGDERSLALELLSMKNDAASLIVLQNFVGNPKTVTGNKWDRKKELEAVLRAQAVESIAAFPEKNIAISTLDFLKTKVDESFLLDRIGRASTNLKNFSADDSNPRNETLKK